MSLFAVFVLLGTTLTVNCDKHSLTYIYTAFSKKPVGLPSRHEFTAMGQLDNSIIDYFDSDHQVMVPKQPWMKEPLFKDYLKNETQFRHRQQQWCKDNIKDLMKRMRQNESDTHVLQLIHGCEGEMQPDGRITLIRSISIYGYDGDDYLFYNNTRGVRVDSKECMGWMEKFMIYRNKQLEEASPPKVFIFAKNTNVKTNITLTCFAMGFYPKDIVLLIRRNGRVLFPEDGLYTSGPRPNGDDTFQRRDSVEILRSDMSKYTCEVIHEASRIYVKEEWDHKLPSDNGGPNIGAAVGGVLVVVVVLVAVILFLKKKGTVYDGHGNVRIRQPESLDVREVASAQSMLLAASAVSMELEDLMDNNEEVNG